MKEKDLRPGTVFPVLGTLLFFLPERYKEKLCCVTPLASEVNYRSLPALVFCQFSYSRAVNLLSPEPSTRSLIKLARETECLAARRRRRATARRKKPRPFLLPARSCLPVIRRLPCDPSYRATLWAAPRVLREGSVRTFVGT